MNISPASALDLEKRLGLTSGLIAVNGNQLHFEAAGRGLPILFLHDGLADSRGFDSQFEFFAKNYTVVRYDRQGYGSSKPPDVPYSEVNDLKSIFDMLGLETAILIGGSAGGRLAMNFAITHPSHVAALVLVGPAVSGFDFSDHMWYRGWRNEYGDSVPEFIDFWVNDLWLIHEDNKEARARLQQILESSTQNLLNFPVEKLEDVKALPRLSEIQAPTLIVIGEHDIADNHVQAGIIQVNIKDAARRVVLHSGHLVYMEQPEEFNKVVGEFLSGLLPSKQ